MWMACTNRDTIKVAAQNGLGVLAFSFLDPEEAKTWTQTYYDTIMSEECIPLGHSVNANIAMVSAFSLHDDHDEASRRGEDGFRFFEYAIGALVTTTFSQAEVSSGTITKHERKHANQAKSNRHGLWWR